MTSGPRVLHVITGLGTGGAETSLLRLLESLGAGARQHRVISLMDRGTLGSAIERTGATLVTLGLARGRWGVGPVRRLADEARRFMPDVLHGWMYHGALAASVTAALLPGRIPVLWGVRHALDDWEHESPGFRRFFRAMALLSGLPSRIVYNSARSKEQHEAGGFRRTRGLVIPNGFDVQRFAPDATAGARVRAELGIERGAPVVALVARVDPLKDHATFLAAAALLAARLPAARFVLAGKDTDRDAGIRAAIAAHGLGDRVSTLGERPDVAAIFNAASIATLTSVSEGFPNVVGEAMACGRACVVTDVGDAPDLVGQTGLVVRRRDAQTLADAWHSLLFSSAREDLGARARTRVTQEFALPAITGQWQRLYEEVRSHPAPRGVGATGSGAWRALHAFTVDMSVRFIEGQATALKPSGVELEVISSPGPELDAIARREGVRTHAVPMARRITPFADVVALWRLLAIILDRQPDATHAHTPKAGLLFTLAGWLCRVPVRTYHVHGLPWQTARGLRRYVLMASERVACAAATDIWCVSHSVRNALIEAGLASPTRATVIGGGSVNGVDARGAFSLETVDPDAIAAVRARHGIPAGAPVVGFIGRLVCDKGLRELTAAWPRVRASCPDAHLLVVGPEERHDPLPTETREQLAHLPGVHVHGADWNTPPLFGAMDLFVLPTYREGFPTVLLEAAAMHRPVVATRVAGCTDAVHDGVTGVLVPARDSTRLASAIIEYLRDPDLRTAHASAARRRVEQEYDVRLVHEAIATACAGMRGRAARRQRRRGPVLAKRIIDVAVSATSLLALAPVFFLTAVAVRVALGRPVFFRQARPGLDGRPFMLLKFRTMRDAADASGRPLSDARRLTPFGRWLRSTSLDELPELWNVLRGDMSLVGPRPLLMQYLPLYTTEQARRHEIQPGITGWAQVHGRNALSWDDRFRHDVWYVDHRSPALDLRILARTLATVVTRRGVSAPGEATVANFTGASHAVATAAEIGALHLSQSNG